MIEIMYAAWNVLEEIEKERGQGLAAHITANIRA